MVVLGKAGTGKTFLLRRIIELLKPSKQIEVTSASGISTFLFESAKTLHSFANTCREAKEDIFKRIKTSSPDIIKKWQSLEALIIDKASMISARVCETVEFLLQSARENDIPFGGLQVIVSADFFQLPPVGDGIDNGEYIFQFKHWSTIFPHIYMLTEIVRQDEAEFITFLGNLAEGV